MKVRMMMIEADDVTPADVAEVIATAMAPREAPPAPAVPAPPPPRVALPPLETRVDMARLDAGYRPRSRKVQNPTRETSQPRPVAAAKKMCDECGADKPEGLHGRANCPKCGKRAWVTVPAHRDVSVPDGGDGDE